jgi:hypothetical protein
LIVVSPHSPPPFFLCEIFDFFFEEPRKIFLAFFLNKKKIFSNLKSQRDYFTQRVERERESKNDEPKSYITVQASGGLFHFKCATTEVDHW